MLNTRDCFAYDLLVKETLIDRVDEHGKLVKKGVIKREYFFETDNLPENYTALFMPKDSKKEKIFKYPVGVVSYENFFTHEELLNMERKVEHTEDLCENRAYLPGTA